MMKKVQESFTNVSTDVLFIILWKNLDDTPHCERLKRLKELSLVCKRWHEVLHRRLTQIFYGSRYFTKSNWDEDVVKTRKYFTEIDKTCVPENWFTYAGWDNELPADSKEPFDVALDNEIRVRENQVPVIRQFATTEQFLEHCRISEEVTERTFFQKNIMLGLPDNHLVELMDDPQVVIPEIYALSSNIFELPRDEWKVKSEDYNQKIGEHWNHLDTTDYRIHDSDFNQNNNPRIDQEIEPVG